MLSTYYNIWTQWFISKFEHCSNNFVDIFNCHYLHFLFWQYSEEHKYTRILIIAVIMSDFVKDKKIHFM